jgi:hypothetical protein
MPDNTLTRHANRQQDLGAGSGNPAIMSVVNINSRTPLRRAVYIHVSDLISAYNIDHARLEAELARVKAEAEAEIVQDEDTSRSSSMGGVPTELDTSYPKKRLQPPRGGNNMVV